MSENQNRLEELQHMVQEAVDANMLPDRAAEILRRRVGLMDGHPHTLEEVAEEFGITRERVRQIENRYLRKHIRPVRRKMIRDFYEADSPKEIREDDMDDLMDEERNQIQEAVELGLLDEQKTAILRMRLGLDDGRIKSREEVARCFGITPFRVYQMEKRAVLKLRDRYPVKKNQEFF